MDKLPNRETALLEAALDTARKCGLTAELAEGPKLPQPRPDALLKLGQGGDQRTYAVEVKHALRPATLGAALHDLERLGKPALLITDHVTPDMAETLRGQRVPFLDAAGNAYVEQPGLLVWVTGCRPEKKPAAPVMGRAFQPTGLQLVFALLCRPKAINLPYRALAAMAGVAHGTVGWAMTDLQQQGFVADLQGRRGTRRLFFADRLLAQWTDAYARHLRSRLLIGRYYVPDDVNWRDWLLAQHRALWGGEPAGALLTDYLRPGELTLYAEKMPALLAAQEKFLQAPGPGHTKVLEVRRKFWQFESEDERTVPPVLVYADLLATGDARCIETAKQVYDDHVVRLLQPT